MGIGNRLTLGSSGLMVRMGFESPALRWLSKALIAWFNECQSVGANYPFALKRPANGGPFLYPLLPEQRY